MPGNVRPNLSSAARPTSRSEPSCTTDGRARCQCPRNQPMTLRRRLKTHFRAICELTTLTTRQALTQGRVGVALGSGSLGTMTTNMPYCTRRTTMARVIHLLTMERYQHPTDRLVTSRQTITPATVVRTVDIVTHRSKIWITRIHHHHMVDDNVFSLSQGL